MEQKTIKEWFETLPEPIRSQALENAKWALFMVCKDLETAIYEGFSWNRTPKDQGYDYWESITTRVSSGEFN